MSDSYTGQLFKRKPAPGDFNWDNEWHENEDIDDVVAGALLSENRLSSGGAVTDGGGLNADYADCYVYVGGSVYKITGATAALTGGAATDDTGKSNWIYVDSSGAVQVSTTPPTGEYVPLALVDCDASDVLRVADLRPLTPGLYRMVENGCINGTFDIWQRYDGTSQTADGYGADDRWRNSVAGSAQAVTRQAFTAGQTDVPGNPKYYSRSVVVTAAGATNYVRKEHRILDVRKYSGKRVCVKIHGKADASRNIALEVVQNFGSGGSSQIDSIGAQKIALTASFVKNVAFIDVPSVTGKTIGAASYTRFIFWFDAGSDFNSRSDTLGQQDGTFEIAEVEIYPSDKELPVRRRTREEELVLCEDYCEKTYDLEVAPGTVTTAGQNFAVTARSTPDGSSLLGFNFKRKIVIPSVKIFSPSTGTIANMKVVATDTAVSSVNIGQSYCTIQNGSGGSIADQSYCTWHVLIEGEL